MPGKQLYEYAVIRVVPQVEREEFMNVGVILYSRGLRFLKMRYAVDDGRLSAFAPGLDVLEVGQYLESMSRICCGGKDGGPIGQLDAPSRFRWLTATRSTVVQTSKVHPGFCVGEAEAMLEGLFTRLAAPADTTHPAIPSALL